MDFARRRHLYNDDDDEVIHQREVERVVRAYRERQRQLRRNRMRRHDPSSSDDEDESLPVETPQDSTGDDSAAGDIVKGLQYKTDDKSDADKNEAKTESGDVKPESEGDGKAEDGAMEGDGEEKTKKPEGGKDAAQKSFDDKDSKASKSEGKLDPKLVGMSVGLKHLYSGKEDKRGRFQWQTTIPEDVGKPAEDAETQKWALIVRHIKVYNDPEKVLAVHSIVVQSPLLKDLLKSVLKGYPGVTVGLQRLELGGKFEPLIHRWVELKAAIEELRQKVKSRDDKKANAKHKAAGEEHEGDDKGQIKGESKDESKDKDDTGSTTEAGLKDDVEHDAKETTTDEAVEDVKDVSKGDVKHEIVDEKGKVVQPTTADGKAGEPKIEDNDSTLKPDKKVADLTPEERDATKLRHAELLYNLLVSEFQTLIDSSQDMKTKSVMTYECLWTLFQPGSFIFSKVEGQERVFRLRSGRYGLDRDGNPVFWLLMLYVEYDGVRFGYQKLNACIRAFSGTRGIQTLSSFPFTFHQQKDEVKNRLVARGAKVESLAGTHYRAYDGMGWKTGYQGQKEKYSVKERIIVDTYGWNRWDPNETIYVTPLNKEEVDMRGNVSESISSEDESVFGDFDNDMEDGMPIDGHFDSEDEAENRTPLDEDQKLICTHLVRGYALKQKMWLNMYANSVSEIAFNERAFESLVLPEATKELILGFTSSQQTYRNQFDDVIEGKGRGIILLLSGMPGVGKTLTAESVAEEMRVPLFVMSAGDVGLDSRHVEGRLLDVFEMVTRWNAILLLDEADVFLEERSLHEIERNKLVSIFLRVLEYYEGIMFLTTNRVQTFDAAFQSRIHISIDYPELSIESRKQVWKNFLQQHNAVQEASRRKGPPKPIPSSIKNTPSKAKEGKSKVGTDAEANDRKDNGISTATANANVAATTATTDGEFRPGDVSTANTNVPDKADTTEQAESATTKSDQTAQATAAEKTESSASSKTEEKPRQSELEKAEADKNHQLATQPHCITDRDIDVLSRMHMNGRQIKNVLKTAQLLASRRKEGLGKKHIETVLEVTQHLHNSTRETERTRSSIFA